MRKFLIAAAMTASSVALAAPAAAQWAQPSYGYGYGYNNNYGNHYGHARSYQARINQLHQRIHRLEGRLSRAEFLRLNREIDALQYRVRRASFQGISPWESRDLNWRFNRLERTIYRDARDGRDDHHGNPYGHNPYGWDRDRDGLDDRYERDRGTNYDEDRDHD